MGWFNKTTDVRKVLKKQAYLKESAKQAKQQGVKQARQETSKPSSSWDLMGGLGRLSSSFSGPPPSASSPPTRRTGKMRKVTTYVKSGKGYKKKTYYKPVQKKNKPSQPSGSFMDIGKGWDI